MTDAEKLKEIEAIVAATCSSCPLYLDKEDDCAECSDNENCSMACVRRVLKDE